MKIAFVCDNRDALNWGCRATSIALLSRLSRIGEIRGSINRNSATMSLPVGVGLNWISEAPLVHRLFHGFGRGLRRLGSSGALFGWHVDVVKGIPSRALAIALRHRRSNAEIDRLFSLFECSDIVVINGEGSMIFTKPVRRDLMFQMFCVEIAHHLGKPAYYVNALVSPCPKHGINRNTVERIKPTLEKLAAFVVRDPLSFEVTRQLFPKLESRFIPDALFDWAISRSELMSSCILRQHPELLESRPEGYLPTEESLLRGPYICVSGASRPPGVSSEGWVPQFVHLIGSLKDRCGVPVVVVSTCEGDDFLQVVASRAGCMHVSAHVNIFAGFCLLANSRVLISGRYHPSIMAACGGTPTIFMTSNSHKTSSLQRILGYEPQVEFQQHRLAEDSERISQICSDYLDRNEYYRGRIAERARAAANALDGYQGIISPFAPPPQVAPTLAAR